MQKLSTHTRSSAGATKSKPEKKNLDSYDTMVGIRLLFLLDKLGGQDVLKLGILEEFRIFHGILIQSLTTVISKTILVRIFLYFDD